MYVYHKGGATYPVTKYTPVKKVNIDDLWY